MFTSMLSSLVMCWLLGANWPNKVPTTPVKTETAVLCTGRACVPAPVSASVVQAPVVKACVGKSCAAYSPR